ncbi:E3 ubiquitin-protein ligase RNF213-like [Heteronotia binoei]|uniref:E3 ubiquitin-protein ligase RNF213-like n=1 Tax=Heteronotia binoei TaxID=13085 RepID=UPI00292DB1F5|nr:E3 ubiquitin-protein ligase RNF213-like [Heteronotia binoei]
MTSVEEMETGGELKVESISPLKPDGGDHPPTELVQKELQDSLPECTGDQDWVSSKKKKKKKKRNASDSELQDSLSSALSTLNYSLNTETADENNPAEQSQAEVTKPERGPTEDDGHQNKSCSPLDLDQNPVNEAQNHSDKNDIMLHADQVLEKGSKNGAVAAGEKMEKEDSKMNVVVEQLGSSRGQNNKHSSAMEKTLENTNPGICTGSAKTISDLHLNVGSSENTGANSIAEDQNLTKMNLPESETKETCEKGIEKGAKEQRRDSDTKKVKLEEKTEEGNTCKKPATQTEGNKEKGKAAAASNQKKQQSNQNNEKQQKNKSPVNFRDGITVYFHAILSKDFKLDLKNHKVFVRAQSISGYVNWKDNVCELTCSKNLGEHGHLFDGWVTISKDNMNKPIPYKYYVSRGKGGDYEFIYKVCHEGMIVNRCLYINSDELSGTDWHQYDDIVCAKSDSWWSRVKDHFPGKNKTVKGKEIAAKIMLEGLFSMLHPWTPINVKNFLQQLRQFYLVNRKQLVYEGVQREWTELEFGEMQVKQLMLDYLREIARQVSDQNCTNSSSHSTVVHNRLGLTLIILLLGELYSLPILKSDLKQLCKLLCLEKPQVDVVNEIRSVKELLRIEHCFIALYNNCIEEQIHDWLWTIPIFHLFSASVDFAYDRVNSLFESEERYAGLEGIMFRSYREKHSSQKVLLQLMKEKKHLVEGDRALFRSWFSLLPLKDLVEFITDFSTDLLDCLLGIFHRLKNVIIIHDYEVVEKILQKVLCIQWNNQNRIPHQDIWNASVTVCIKLHQMICNNVKIVKNYKIPATSAEIVSKILGLAPLEIFRESTSQNTPMTRAFERCCEDTRSWLRRALPKHLLKETSVIALAFREELEAWDFFLKINFPDENFTQQWKTTLISEMRSRIKQEHEVRQIKVYCDCHTKLEELHPLIGNTFENCAIEAVNLASQTQKNLLDIVFSYNLSKMGTLVSAVIVKSWPRDRAGEPMSDLEGALNHLLTWPDIKHLFIFNGTGGDFLDQLTDEAKECMAIADSIYSKVSDDLDSGHILVKLLELIFKYKKQFLSIWELKKKCLSPMEKTDQRQALEKLLELRFQEVLSVKREQKILGSFLDMCRKVQDIVKVDISEIEQKLSENLSSKALNQIVTVRHPGDYSDGEIETFYNLSPALKKTSNIVHDFKESHLFRYCWEWAAKNLLDDNEDLIEEEDFATLGLDGVLEYVYEPCYSEFCRLYSRLKSGELMFAEVDSLFRDFTDNYEELKRDLKVMCNQYGQDGGEWIDNRVQQIQQYHELHLAMDSAKVINKVKEGLSLSGDFTVLQLLLNFSDEFQSFQQEKLSWMSPQLISAKKLLQSITEPRRRCLEELTLRRDFVNWVREALEDITELKVFVDLASISAGENDMDVDRVACFHDAVLGYSSLLYELKQESGFEEFMECLKKLWKALKSDSNLPPKLRDSARYLEWLKTIKESHGSVELSSISLATTINSKGIYVIRAPVEGQKVSLETVLSLTISESHSGQEELRRYSLEELKELMNKLMLMSGKVEQGAEVEKFSEIFSSVQRLALSFIRLYSAGNMLFRSWITKIYCSPNSKFCIVMDFNLKFIRDFLGSGKVIDVLPALCRKMESFLERWECFMAEKRSQYFYLNYYMAEQLVYLCRELGSKCPSEAALLMLSFIKHNCSKQNVQEVSRRLMSRKSESSLDDLFGLMVIEKELTERLEDIWESYMKSMSSFVPGCLDIDTLGDYLDCLAGMENRRVLRTFPPGLHSDRPNLILCPRSEVLASALAIYMVSPEEMPPSYDEVLLCTPQTSYEQVALFLRRCLALGCREKKIYTMLYADELSYDVGYRFEELFRNLHLKHQDDYRLVILCNCEREHCYVPAAFSQFKVHMIPQQPLKNVQRYLGNHYKTMQSAHSSASIFKDEMCVGIVSSTRAGVGKSLYIKRLHEKLKVKLHDDKVPLKTIRLIDSHVDEGKVLKALLPFLNHQHQKQPMIFHFDITSSVQSGIQEFLFKLLVLHYLGDTDGKLWLRKQCHLYVIEILETSLSPEKQTRAMPPGLKYNLLDVFPKIMCRPPKEVLDMDTKRNSSYGCSDPGMDDKIFSSEAFQRPFQYLIRSNRGDNLDMFQYEPGSVEGTAVQCLQLLLIHCGVIDPSWSELRNFAWFLNVQLKNCEASVFCNPCFVQDTLQGFKNFVVTFMILMARDFATPSLNISDESPGRQFFDMEGVTEEDLVPFRIRKKWESEPHPYIFFNHDGISMTFLGFHLQANANGGIDAINPLNGTVIKRNVMSAQLYQGLVLQRVPFNVNFDELPRSEKIAKLCMVLGIEWPIDPDETYELTTDNILKILAIEMRFRCGIPVVIMGETGCGKTRLIKFLCELRRCGANTENMALIKVHGGTTADAIYNKVREAEQLAIKNKQLCLFDTILFFDEANTTAAVNSIKEILCDHTVEGQPLTHSSGLQIIAACNPYRKHTEKMIERLESAGLGYHVKAEDTQEKLGSVPLRQLVYRVHALPPSMIPLVWDFGQLNNVTEKLYIQQIVQRLTHSIQMSTADIKTITEVLYNSQIYMRKQSDECSFISLRDVERCVEVFKWFHNHSDLLIKHLAKYLADKKTDKKYMKRNAVIWSLVLSVGVCYHASLEKKEKYRRVISKVLPEPYDNEKEILEEINLIQDLFLNGVPLRETIAKNLALKENVFMMVICIELKIPLFLIGKPGSSKSLAKTIVADAMQGQASYSELYKELKQIHLVSFQCSPHSTPEGIINTFKHCARFQEGKNLQEYVSVVVLDEIGLAEDSPKMPLKTLHPLLEDGCVDDDPHPHKKVGFIGISNWALDPAKMNRGIFVSRGDPNKKELIKSAQGICSSERVILHKIERYFPIFANAYEEICKIQSKEFFGLRDYYSLIKMIFALTKTSKRDPSAHDIAEAVLRNFSGKEDVKALDIFLSKIPEKGDVISEDINTIDLVKQNIHNDFQDGECRYLLVLTQNYAALQILQQAFFNGEPQPEIIFGSSFPKDQEYTQICRNINRVKICMETGQMVVLLNLQNLYESLYDALNQYYVQLAGQKYVDLGLGTHRVKCRVHPKFRLIVIEEKEVVYKQFPIPLINRLEKHYLDINTVLNKLQRDIVEELKKWVNNFIAVDTEKHFMGQQKYSPSDAFVGYHPDTCASVVVQVTEKLKKDCPPGELMLEIQNQAILVLLNCATPDSVVRLGNSQLGPFQADILSRAYFQQQQHISLADFLHACICTESRGVTVFTEITTFSRLLTTADMETLKAELHYDIESIRVLSLQQFDTEHSFLKEIRNFLDATPGNKILIIQTDFENGSLSAQLVASAKYSAVNEINKTDLNQASVFVCFITKLPRVEGGSSYVGFHGGLWQSVHIDDLRRSQDMVSDVTALRDVTISELFLEHMKEPAGNLGFVSPERVEEKEEEMEVEGATALEQERKPTRVLDTTILLRTCVQSAVGMLRDQNEGCNRSTRRIEILLSLLCEADYLKASFLKITKSRLLSLVREQEENSCTMKEWVQRSASNLSALQEAGTFRCTLWKRVQNVVTPSLAYMVSVIDRNANLDLLVRSRTENCVKGLWMFIFSDLKLLNIPYVIGQGSSQTETILVQSYFQGTISAVNEMPFSWRIKDYLEDLWAQARYIPGNKGHKEKFIDVFQKTPLGEYLAELSEKERDTLFHCYLRDFILLTMGVSSPRELEFLQIALLSCIEEMKAASSSAEQNVLPLPWIHLGYCEFRSRLQNFSRILAVCPDVVNALTGHAGREGSIPCHQMVLDVLAALACTEMLEEKLLKCNPKIWLQQVKNLQTPVELVCAANDFKSNSSLCYQLLQRFRSQWNRVFSVSLFVEHVHLGVETAMPEMQELIKKYTLHLVNCFPWDSDIKMHKTFMAVMKVLSQCKEDVSFACCRYGLKPCPVCLGDPKDPVSLPCDHVFCQSCIKQWLVPAQMLCPFCLVSLPNDYTLTVSKKLSDIITKYSKFRKFCNSFFIDLVSTMCFKDNEPPEKAVIQELLKLLFAHDKAVLRGCQRGSGKPSVHTKSLSPFDDVVDKTPVIRSVVLKLLLKYSFSDVKAYMQDYLSQVENWILYEDDKTELYTLFVNCLEDSMCEKSGVSAEEIKTTFMRDDGRFLASYFQWNSQDTAQEISIEYLQGVARIRMCLDRAAELVYRLHGTANGSKDNEKMIYLQRVMQFCRLNDWYKIYFVRKITNQYGLEFTQSLSKEQQYHWIFPTEIIQQQLRHQPGQIDRFLAWGKNYKMMRDAVGKAVIEGHLKSIEAALKDYNGPRSAQSVHFLLAVFREFTSQYGCRDSNLHPTQKQCLALKEMMQNSKVLPSLELRTFAESLVDNSIPSLTVNPLDFSHNRIVIELVVHTGAILLCGQNRVLEPLRNLAFSPHTMQHAFLPTMPEDLLAQAVRWEATAGLYWYTCPNGHPCTIGECGHPMQLGNCVDCGAQIGGTNHRAVPNFLHAQVGADRTQTGHVLGNPGNREAVVASEREMSPAALILIRLLTHLALLLGATKDPKSLLQIIKPQVQDPVGFLLQHIHKDLEQLMNTLGKSTDETTNVAHLILCSFFKEARQHPDQWSAHFDGQLSKKEHRNNWERVAKSIIVPELELLDKSLLELNQQISEDERISSNPVVKIIYSDPATFLSGLPKNRTVHCSKMWNCRKRISVEYLGHVVQQKGGKDTVPILWKFLQKEAELRLVKFLPEILALQKELVKRFQNAVELEYHRISDFLHSLRSDVTRRTMEKQVGTFLSVWNKLRRSLETNGEIKLPKGYCAVDLTLQDEFAILLPRRRGLGLCSTALASYLIGLHNDFVYTIEKPTKDAKSYSVSPTEVTDLHVITYEVEKDLIPLILSNCQYSIEKGGEALQEFDLEKIQQQVISRFLQGKPFIKLTGIPTLVYRHDRNYEHLFNDIKRKLKQSSLPNSTISMISGELQSYSDICEALFVTEITLGFLAMAGGEAEMTTTEYVENTLQMGTQTNIHVLKALSRCQLQHIIGLWQLLSSRKSEQLLQLKRDPFAEVGEAYKAELSAENTKLLNTFLLQAGMETFLQELHEMIILKLKYANAGDEFNPGWSLKDVLISYLERKETVLGELEDTFPEDIQLSQCIAVWKATAALKRDRRLS